MSCPYKIDFVFEPGEIEDIMIDVTRTGGFSSIDEEKAKVIRCSNGAVVAAETDISANSSAITDGERLLYLLDTTGYQSGDYYVSFSFKRDGTNKTRKKRVYFQVKSPNC